MNEERAYDEEDPFSRSTNEQTQTSPILSYSDDHSIGLPPASQHHKLHLAAMILPTVTGERVKQRPIYKDNIRGEHSHGQ